MLTDTAPDAEISAVAIAARELLHAHPHGAAETSAPTPAQLKTAMSIDVHGWTDAVDCQLARVIFRTGEWDVVAGMTADRTVMLDFGPGHIRSIELSVGAA